MAGLLRPVTALLIAAAILLMGNGLLGVLIPVRADVEQFTRLEIGLLGSAYYAGLMAGCLLGPLVIARVGHIRAFVAFTAIATIRSEERRVGKDGRSRGASRPQKK